MCKSVSWQLQHKERGVDLRQASLTAARLRWCAMRSISASSSSPMGTPLPSAAHQNNMKSGQASSNEGRNALQMGCPTMILSR